MPIFMDRHDMRGATAENVAVAHRRDLEIQDKYGVKYMTYWYNSERSLASGSSMRLTPRLRPGRFQARPLFRSRSPRELQNAPQVRSLAVWRRLVPKENPRPCKNLGGAS